ncbi:hypothetical protein E4P41_05570 [Geodermatophilus sp. DF01-2]|uniref:hypothetical protein n=1 Tax=Geodermatophilus sp. DF01-2 TaxID=2559610 RepID=UPI0010737F4F|nr:hypothetical protein [Geodermatophilus sp. DF01_2]TFV63154.1 hypothetical protein E4P41_05570 [Geodermatophilus sp. DF01_2]
MVVLLVDAANVVGARPDGWWRDRAGATSRLLRRLAPLAGREVTAPGGGPVLCGEVVAVVEGTARAVARPGGVTLVRAPGSGDDALAACAARLAEEGRDVLVVTADRGLRARLPAGVAVAGPGWLYRVLDHQARPDGAVPDAPA